MAYSRREFLSLAGAATGAAAFAEPLQARGVGAANLREPVKYEKGLEQPAFLLLPLGAMAVVTSWLGSRPGEVVGFAFLAFLNIHHYFTDGVMWKLRNPAVRQDLFGHLARPEPVPASAQAVSKPASRQRHKRKAR